MCGLWGEGEGTRLWLTILLLVRENSDEKQKVLYVILFLKVVQFVKWWERAEGSVVAGAGAAEQ